METLTKKTKPDILKEKRDHKEDTDWLQGFFLIITLVNTICNQMIEIKIIIKYQGEADFKKKLEKKKIQELDENCEKLKL